ncbi:MAG: septum formation initiator family protein [Gorillibacterium sp.]|nr:septum formation initiator family protein [Gorillibacterium sp.]
MPQASKRQPKRSCKASVRRMRLAFVVMIALTIPILITAWNQNGQLRNNTAQLEELKSKLANRTELNNIMLLELKRMNDPEYKQEIIRSELNYAKKGETVFEPADPDK